MLVIPIGVAIMAVMTMVTMAVLMVVAMALIVSVMFLTIPMRGSMPLLMIMILLAVVQALPRSGPARILTENERLDRNRNGTGRHADAPEVDIVEIPQHDAINHKKFALDMELIAQQVP